MTMLPGLIALAISTSFGVWFYFIAKRRGDDRFAVAVMGFLIGPLAFLLLSSAGPNSPGRRATNHVASSTTGR